MNALSLVNRHLLLMYSTERLPPRKLETKWIKNTFDRICVETMVSLDVYQNCFDYRSQCHCAHSILKIYGWSNSKIAKLFGVDHKAFEKQVKLPVDQRDNGRPSTLDEDEQLTLIEKIKSLNDSNMHPTLYDIEQFVIEHFKKYVTTDTLRNYIIQSQQFKLVEGEPQDEDRVNVRNEDLDTYYANLAESVDGVPASLVFNMDEAGQDEYVDTHAMKVIVPSTYTHPSIKIPVRRPTKRSTIVHCICNDGTFPKPLLIIPRKTLDGIILKKLTCHNVIIKFQSKGYTNTEIMKYWLTNIFFPYVERKWQIENRRTGYTGKAVLILDGLSAHAAAINSFNLEQRHLKIIYLIPHSSHLTQPLDLVTFSIQKLITTKKRVGEKLTYQSDQIRSIIKGIQQASTSESIIGAFESAGIFHTFSREENIDFNNYMPKCIVKKEYARYYKTEGNNYTINNFRIGFQ